MPTPAFDSAIGVLLWMLVMVVPLLVIYIRMVEVRTMLIVLVYPILIATLVRSPRFIIHLPLLYLAAVAAFIFLMGLRMIPKVRRALAKPEENEAISASVFGGSIGLFFIILFVGGIKYGMYNGNVGHSSSSSF